VIGRGIRLNGLDFTVIGVAPAVRSQTNRVFGAALRTELQGRLGNDPVTPLMAGVFFAIVLVELAIACANVANLTLSRGQARACEIAVRLTIDASRSRLVRQLMAESRVIAAAGGALSLLVAQICNRCGFQAATSGR
jgi:putative ABC transport system permease protein